MAVSGKVILLKNDQALRAQDASGNAVSIFKLDSSAKLQLLKMPEVSADPTEANHLARKSFIDAQFLIRDGRLDAVEGDVSTLEGKMDVVQGDDATAGSIAKAKKDAIDYVNQKIADLVNGAPAMLDTLKELADAIANDPQLAQTLAQQIGALDSRLDIIEGDELTSGSIANAVKAERQRAEGVEEALDGRLDTAEGDIDSLEGRMASAETSLSSLASSTAITELDGRIDVLEAAMPTKAAQSDLEQEIQDRQDADSGLDERIGEFEMLGVGARLSSVEGVAQNAANGLIQEIQDRQDADALKVNLGGSPQTISSQITFSEDVSAQKNVTVPNGFISAASVVVGLDGFSSEGQASFIGKAKSFQIDPSTGAALPRVAVDQEELTTKKYVDDAIAPMASQSDLDSLEGRVDVAESDIDSLESRMGSAETALSSLASSSAIVELDGRIDVLEAAMPLKALQSDLEQESQDREDADVALGVRIDNILSNVDPDSLDSLSEVVSAFEAADQNLNNAITSLASSASSALQSEVTRATGAEQALSDAIALKAAKTYVDSQDLAAIQTAKDYADELAAGMTYMHELHVNFDFEGTSDGSPMKPYKSIQDAVDAAVSMNQGANNHIMVHNPNDTVISEDIVINNAVTNLFIEGLAHVKDGAAVRIDGSITIQGNSNRVRLKGISVVSPSSSTPALSVVGTPGRHIFEKCAFETGGVSFSGSYQNWASFVDCSLDGPVVFAGTPSANTLITMYGLFGGQADITVNSANVIVSLMDSYSLKSLTHSAGTLAVDNLRSIGSAGIVSTSSSGFLSLTRVSMQQPDLSFAPINKSGSAPYQLISVHRGETADTLSGTRVAFGPTATDAGYKMGVSGNWSSAVYSVGAALDSLAANKATTASVTSGLAGKASTTLNNLGTTSINSDLLPSASGARSIGSSLLQYLAGWFQTVRTNAIEAISGALSLKTSDSAAAATGAMTIKTGNATAAGLASGPLTIGTGSVTTGVRGDVIFETLVARPLTGNTSQLGSLTYPWGSTYASQFMVRNGATTDGYVGRGALIDGSYPLGISGLQGLSLSSSGLIAGQASKKVIMSSGDAVVNYNSGDVQIKTGAVSGTGVRGKAFFDVSYLDVNSAKISNLAEPSASSDAATKSFTEAKRDEAKTYADGVALTEKNRALAAEGALDGRLDTVEALKVQVQAYEHFTLGAGDLSSITVSAVIKGTPWIMREGIMGRPDVDFTFSGSTITFAGQWVHPSGVSSVEEGDEIFVFYMKEVNAF